MRRSLGSRRGKIAIAAAALAVAAFVFRSQVVELLIAPIGWLLWAGWRLLASVDQGICWALVVLFGAVAFLRLLPPRIGVPEESLPARESRWGRMSRLDHWDDLARRAAQSHEGLTAFHATLTVLEDAVAEGVKQPPPRRARAISSSWRLPVVSRLFTGRRRQADLRALEDRLLWMESALEIKHDDSVD